MLFRPKKRLMLAFFGLALCLAGCAGKQEAPVQLELAMPDIHDSNAENLDAKEVAVLKTTGQIDKHLPDEALPEVAAQYKYFLRKGRNTMCSFSKRSEQYLAYARQVFKSRGMPEELANLAIVESGYRSNAVSHAGAAGAWQFMPETGQRFGLAQDWWQDERLDPYKATEAAADYLQKLYNQFGDWPTAIAAYNAGEGKIARAKEGTGGRDFYEVNARNHQLDEKAQLREETRQYVPRFIAITKIMRNLPSLGFEPIEPEAAPQIARLTAKPGTDLRGFSAACDMSWAEFAKLNGHHKRYITCTDKETFVYVPSHLKNKAENFLCAANRADFSGWKPVKIANSRDTLEKISKRSNVPLAKLRYVNPGLDRLSRGQIILAPLSVKLAPQMAEAKPEGKIAAKQLAQSGKKHLFGKNDTLYSLAKKYNTTVEALKSHNNIADAGRLKQGAAIYIPQTKGQPVEAGAKGSIGRKKAVYTVQAKDNLWSIARRHKITVEELKRLNKGWEKGLRPGVKLVVASE